MAVLSLPSAGQSPPAASVNVAPSWRTRMPLLVTAPVLAQAPALACARAHAHVVGGVWRPEAIVAVGPGALRVLLGGVRLPWCGKAPRRVMEADYLRRSSVGEVRAVGAQAVGLQRLYQLP